jgi:hypothetical protein
MVFIQVLLTIFALHCVTTNAVTLNLNFIKNAVQRGAVCNDGSPGGYYFRQGSVNTWVIHQEGGWCCWDNESCSSRAANSPVLVSSKTWTKTTTQAGIFSEYSEENPTFYTANMVYMGYCSSDNWAGTRDPIGTEGTDAWYFKGSVITKSIVEDLFEMGLNASSEILFTGCSAGGKGVWSNVDLVRSYLPFTPAKYLGFSDEGWISDFGGVMDSITWYEMFQLGQGIWVPNVNPTCAIAHPDHEFLCIYGSIVLPYIDTPTVAHAEQYDIVQWNIDCNCNFNPSNTTHMGWMEDMRSSLVASYRTVFPPHSLFSPACASHCSSLGEFFTGTKINGISLSDHLTAFWEKGGSIPSIVDNCQSFNCSVNCP